MHLTLEELGLVDAPPEREFANLCSLACELLNVPAAHVSVADEGIGITPEHQHKIFDLFCRLQLRDAYEGAGIGLALCRRVAEDHHGAIEVASDGAAGTTFTLRLPEPSA